MNALELRNDLHATLAGDPIGEKPNSYGEIRSLTLPNSMLHVWFSTKFFRLAPGTDAEEIDPDISAPESLADDLAGRDRALEAAIAGR
jgi:hypothetical protein